MPGDDTPPRLTRPDGRRSERSDPPACGDRLSERTGTRRPFRADDRAQAFTLEGFIASVVVLTAILFALQAIVLTPTSGGQIDEEVRSSLATQAKDVLTASAHNGTRDLSHHVRFFSNESNGTWVGNSDELDYGYENDQPLAPSESLLGTGLNKTFKQRGFTYNVELEHLSETEPDETETVNMVFRGVPTEEAVSVTYTVVLYDNETLTVPASKDADCANKQIEEVVAGDPDFNGSGDCFYPIPEAELFDDDDNEGPNAPSASANADCSSDTPGCETGETGDTPIYNIVEVRVVVW